MSAIEVPITRLSAADPDVPLPAYATAGAAGMDLRANFDAGRRAEGVTLAPGARALIPTGLALAIPEGFEAQVRPRSGLAVKHGLMLVNAPGTIDSDYRGEVGVIVLNAGEAPFTVTHAMRLAQIVLAPVTRGAWREVASLPDSARGAGGFGSTGR